MSETRLYDRRNGASSSRRVKEFSYRSRPPPMPRLSSAEFSSRKDSLLPASATNNTTTVTTPLMTVNSRMNGVDGNCTNEICDCISPSDCDRSNNFNSIKYRHSSPHTTTAIMINGENFKSESC